MLFEVKRSSGPSKGPGERSSGLPEASFSNPPQPAEAFKSKLPEINPGNPIEPADDGAFTKLEKLVFPLAIAGIVFLIFVEIFINSPLFPPLRELLTGSGSRPSAIDLYNRSR